MVIKLSHINRCLVLCAILFFNMETTLSQDASLKQLHVGDTLQDLELKHVLNYKTGTAKISSFTKELLILDFWATWCGPCIYSLSKSDSIEKHFRGQVKILPVSYESEIDVKSFLKRMSKIIPESTTMLTEDDLLQNIFQHTTLPHFVWLDKNRKVIAITQGADVSMSNIEEFLSSGKVNYQLKSEDRILVKIPAFSPSVQVKQGKDTLLVKLPESEIISNGILTKFVEGLIPGGSFPDSTYFALRNVTIAHLYKIALFGNTLDVLNSSTIKIEITDSILFMKILGVGIDGKKIPSGLASLAWLKDNGYCYESRVPLALSQDRFNIMKDDLNRYFGVVLGIVGLKERRLRKCFALVRTNASLKFASKGSKPSVNKDRYHYKIENQNIKTFLADLAFPLQSAPPLIDQTDYKGNVDLELNCNLSDINSLNKELDRYGLKFVETNRMIDTGIIRMK